GALLWQIRYFDPSSRREGEHVPHPVIRLLVAIVLGATVFGSLWAIANEEGSGAATGVTIGLAASLVPILLRVLPPLSKSAATRERDTKSGVTVAGLVLYTIAVAGLVVLLNT